jgi:hypothetical protein
MPIDMSLLREDFAIRFDSVMRMHCVKRLLKAQASSTAFSVR